MKKILLLLLAGLLLTACGDKKKSDADDKKADKSEVKTKGDTAVAGKVQSSVILSEPAAAEEEEPVLPEAPATTTSKTDDNHATAATAKRQSRWSANQQEAIDLFNRFITRLDAAQTMSDLVSIFQTFKRQADRLDAKLTAAEQNELEASAEYQSLMSRLQTVAERAGERCAMNCIESGEDPTPYLQELQKYM